MINFSNDINNLSDFIPLIPKDLMFLGYRKLIHLFMEERLKGMDKKVIFDYLIENRCFINSLSDDDIKFYYSVLKSYKKIRLKNKIKKLLNISNELEGS